MQTLAKQPVHNAFVSVKGFTLIELMIVLVILSIIAAAAVSNYRRQVIQSAETTCKKEMQHLASGYERFKARNFTYSGFSSEATLKEFYEEANNTVVSSSVAVPKGSLNLGTELCRITLVDASTAGGAGISDGARWRMFATPRTGQAEKFFFMDSVGSRCQNKVTAYTANTVQCNTTDEVW